MELWDDDAVEAHNTPASFLAPHQEGMLKTEALARNVAYMCQDEDIAYDLRLNPERFPVFSPMATTPVLIVAVDDLPTRQRIWNILKRERQDCAANGEDHPVKLLIDARSGLDLITIYAVALSDENADTSVYEESFTRGSAEIPCSGRAVAYNSATCAGLVTRMVAAYANGDYIPRRVTFDHKTWFYFAE